MSHLTPIPQDALGAERSPWQPVYWPVHTHPPTHSPTASANVSTNTLQMLKGCVLGNNAEVLFFNIYLLWRQHILGRCEEVFHGNTATNLI